jgi:hypothetical protein
MMCGPDNFHSAGSWNGWMMTNDCIMNHSLMMTNDCLINSEPFTFMSKNHGL